MRRGAGAGNRRRGTGVVAGMRLALIVSLVLSAGCADRAAAPASAFESGVQGIRVRQTPIAVEGGAGRLIVVEVAPEVAVEVLPAWRPAALQSIAGASEGRACVAINGGFYDLNGAMGWVVHEGEEVAPLRAGGGSGALLIDEAGARIVHRDAASGRPKEALQSIDRVVDGGRSLVGPGARPDADARSAVALRGDGTVVFVVMFADQAVVREGPGRVELGPASSSTGMSLAAWAELLARPVAQGGVGAVTALNLDGGYSTSLALHLGEVELDVVAHGATINALRACAG